MINNAVADTDQLHVASFDGVEYRWTGNYEFRIK
jgi:hypothetical protein